MLDEVIGGRYRIVQHLGGGGFGQTYLAEDRHLPGAPRCVVKQLKPKLTDELSMQTARRLFDTEAKVLYALGTHDQIPRLYAHFEESQEFYLVQELIEGEVLTRELIRDIYTREETIISMLHDILGVLEFVHQQNVVHRDIKPSNIIKRSADGRMVLIDFGAVKEISHRPYESNGHTYTISVGSSGYTPNEQLAGNPRFNSDIYSVGVIAIQALTRTPVKRLTTDPRTGELVWRDRAQCSSELAEILDRMVRYDFRQRYQSASEVLQDLEELIADESSTMAMASPVSLASDAHLAWFERADELFERERYEEAVTAYLKVIQAKADEVVAWFKLGMALENLRRYDDAVAAYSKVVELHADDYLAWFKRGDVLIQAENFEEAFHSYDQVVKIQPESYWGWRDRGMALEKMQDYDEAVSSYSKAVLVKPEFQIAVEDRKRVLSYLKRGDTLYHLQHYAEAIASCDKAIGVNPNDALAWFMRGMALENMQRYEEAVSSYDRVVSIDPTDHLAWFKRGSALEQLELLEEALQSYAKVVEVQPTHYWAWHDQGRLLERLQRLEDAVDAYDQAVQLKPHFSPAIDGRRRVLNLLKQDSQLRIRFNTEVFSAPQQLTAANSASSLQYAAPLSPTFSASDSQTGSGGAPQVSHSGLDNLNSINHASTQPSKDPSAHLKSPWLLQGQALETSGRYQDAMALYRQGLQAEPKNPYLWYRIGNLLVRFGQVEAGAKAYRQAIRLDDGVAEFWYRLGGAVARSSHYQEASHYFERAIQLQPNRPDFWYWRGRALFELQRYSEAIMAYDCAIALKPDYSAAQHDRQQLQHHLRVP